MPKKTWTNEQKLQIVLSGLKGQSIAQICSDNQISQSLYYKWRDKFLSNATNAFDVERTSQSQQRLERENQRLKTIIGELTIELKKSEVWL